MVYDRGTCAYVTVLFVMLIVEILGVLLGQWWVIITIGIGSLFIIVGRQRYLTHKLLTTRPPHLRNIGYVNQSSNA